MGQFYVLNFQGTVYIRNGITYSLPLIGGSIFLVNPGSFLIINRQHPRLYGKGKESMNWLPYIDLMSKRPAAIKYTEFYQQLPDNWQKYLGNQNAEGKRKGLTSLYTMLQKHDMRTAEEALAFAISNGVKDADSVLAAYRTLTSGVQQMQPMQLGCHVIQMPSYDVDNNKYDTLLGKEVSAL